MNPFPQTVGSWRVLLMGQDLEAGVCSESLLVLQLSAVWVCFTQQLPIMNVGGANRLCPTRPAGKIPHFLREGSAVWASYWVILVPVIKASCLLIVLQVTAWDFNFASARWAQFPGVVVLKLKLVVMVLHRLLRLKAAFQGDILASP